MSPELQVNTPNSFNPKYIPIEALINLSDKGLSYSQISKQLGTTPGNISQRFQRVGYTPDRVKQFNNAKPVILSLIQSKILNSINDEEIEKAPLQTKVWCYGVLHDKQADLERRAQATPVSDDGYDDLQAQLSRLAARSPVVINNILNIVGSLPDNIRDKVQGLIPQSLPAGRIIDCNVSD